MKKKTRKLILYYNVFVFIQWFRINQIVIVAVFWTNYKKVIFVLSLKVVSATFLLFCFLSLKESICETIKNVSYFISKALFVLEKIKF